jgi:hypothetical protein
LWPAWLRGLASDYAATDGLIRTERRRASIANRQLAGLASRERARACAIAGGADGSDGGARALARAVLRLLQRRRAAPLDERHHLFKLAEVELAVRVGVKAVHHLRDEGARLRRATHLGGGGAQLVE